MRFLLGGCGCVWMWVGGGGCEVRWKLSEGLFHENSCKKKRFYRDKRWRCFIYGSVKYQEKDLIKKTRKKGPVTPLTREGAWNGQGWGLTGSGQAWAPVWCFSHRRRSPWRPTNHPAAPARRFTTPRRVSCSVLWCNHSTQWVKPNELTLGQIMPNYKKLWEPSTLHD